MTNDDHECFHQDTCTLDDQCPHIDACIEAEQRNAEEAGDDSPSW